MIGVRIKYLPREAMLRTEMNGGREEWGNSEYLLADVWQASAQSQKPHPARPEALAEQDARVRDPERMKKVNRARRQARARRKAIEEGLIT